MFVPLFNINYSILCLLICYSLFIFCLFVLRFEGMFANSLGYTETGDRTWVNHYALVCQISSAKTLKLDYGKKKKVYNYLHIPLFVRCILRMRLFGGNLYSVYVQSINNQ